MSLRVIAQGVRHRTQHPGHPVSLLSTPWQLPCQGLEARHTTKTSVVLPGSSSSASGQAAAGCAAATWRAYPSAAASGVLKVPRKK
eukprot:2426742-Prymnesium_polylepis.1